MQAHRNLVNTNVSLRPRNSVFLRRALATIIGLIFSSHVFAYIGPGAGLSAIGSVLALIGAVLLMILGFVWYPVKRVMARKKQESLPPEEQAELSEVGESMQTDEIDAQPGKQN